MNLTNDYQNFLTSLQQAQQTIDQLAQTASTIQSEIQELSTDITNDAQTPAAPPQA